MDEATEPLYHGSDEIIREFGTSPVHLGDKWMAEEYVGTKGGLHTIRANPGRLFTQTDAKDFNFVTPEANPQPIFLDEMDFDGGFADMWRSPSFLDEMKNMDIDYLLEAEGAGPDPLGPTDLLELISLYPKRDLTILDND